MEKTTVFKSSYALRLLKGDYNPFTPDVLTITSDFIECRRKNWHLISSDSDNLNFKNVTGIFVDKHLLGATITIKSTGNHSIVLNGFSKKDARLIKEICLYYMNLASRSSSGKSVSSAAETSNDSSLNKNPSYSIVDELAKLKVLLDEGAISQKEFDKLKKRLINR